MGDSTMPKKILGCLMIHLDWIENELEFVMGLNLQELGAFAHQRFGRPFLQLVDSVFEPRYEDSVKITQADSVGTASKIFVR